MAVGAIVVGSLATAVTVSRQTYAPAPPAAAKGQAGAAGVRPTPLKPTTDGEAPRVL